jgi:hypothetical protein
MDIFYGRFRLSGKRIRAMPQRSVTADRLAPTPISSNVGRVWTALLVQGGIREEI